jgi:excisionase family DNA binding protein
METLLTVAEVAAAMKLKEQTIRKMARKGELPCRKIGKVVRFSPSELCQWFGGNWETNSNSGDLLSNANDGELIQIDEVFE